MTRDHRRWRRLWRSLPLLSGAMLVACGGSDESPAPAPAPAPVAQPKACETSSFAGLQLDQASVVSATAVAAGSFTTASGATLANLPAFCRVQARATPTSDSLINFELWVPAGSAWNGKMVTTGNGGYSPALSFGDMAYAMRQGYAVVGGDTGHQSTDPNEMFWGVGHPEKIADWGSRSVHAITVPAKKIVADLSARSVSKAYYYGCSTGGHQAYAELQRYPEDFDGVIAGAPGNNRTRLNVEFLHRFLSNRVPNSNTLILTPAKASLITQRAVAACDALDGVTDGVMEDPRACTIDRFNVESLQCTGADAADCLTPDQVAVAKKIYAGPKNPRTGAQLYPGLPVGTESGWPGYWGGSEPVRADYWRLWAFENPQWNWWTFDYDRDVTFTEAKLGPLVDQTSANLSAFKARGGKAIVYQGWQDPVVNGIDTIAYYDRVKAAQGGSQSEVDGFFRLFMVPGMGHCSGGSGATSFGNGGSAPPVVDADRDILSALDRWVTAGTAPERIVASRVVSGTVVRTRPICAYPKKAVYRGSGSTDDAANFSCQ